MSGSSNAQIGGTATGQGNAIIYNGNGTAGAGIEVKSTSEVRGVTILGNSIFGNHNIGIDIDRSGINLNDPADSDVGANGVQNNLIITSTLTNNAATRFVGTLESKPSTSYQVQFFGNMSCDQSGFGQGQFLLGTTTITTDASGKASVDTILSTPLATGQYFTTTVTNPSGETSEFSACYPGKPLSAPFIVHDAGSQTISGHVYNVDPTKYKILAFLFVPGLGWWSKPFCDEPGSLPTNITIKSDGSWITSMNTGGVDSTATKYAFYVVPQSFTTYCHKGYDFISSSIKSAAVATLVKDRIDLNQRGISFSGYEWKVKGTTVPVDPGPNRFSSSNSDVFIDTDGRLHLKVVKRNGYWYSTEVYMNRSLGYGTYRFYLDSPVDTFDPNLVFGGFVWSDDDAFTHREMDIEFSKWGNAADTTNGQFVVQPYGNSGNLLRYTIPQSIPLSTHSFRWNKDEIFFRSLKGQDPFTVLPTDIIKEWKYTDASQIPPRGDEVVHFNLYLDHGRIPTNGLGAEVIVKKFEFIPSVRRFDLNSDSKDDLLVQNNSTRELTAWQMDGTTVTGTSKVAAVPATGWNLVGTGDFNHDNKPDLLFHNESTRGLVIWYMDGTTHVGGASVTQTVSSGWKVGGVADFNGDGESDILFYNPSTGGQTLWYMKGNQFGGGGSLIGLSGRQIKGVADFNLDGKPDLLMFDPSISKAEIWFFTDRTYRGKTLIDTAIPSGWELKGIADFNYDDMMDIFVANPSNGDVARWTLNGAAVTNAALLSKTVPQGWSVVGPH